MPKTQTRTRPRAERRARYPTQAPRERRVPDWLLWLAAAAPFALAFALLAIFWLPDRVAQSPAEAPAVASLPDTPDYHSLLVDPGDSRHIWLGSHEGLHESTDGGRSWGASSLGGQDAMNLARAPRQSQTVWAAGHNVFARSNDGGQTWTDVEPGGLPSLDVHGFATDPSDPRRLWAAIAGEGLFRSADAGRTFSLVTNEVGPAVMALAVAPDGRVLAGDMEQGLLVSSDGGDSWRRVLAEGLMGLTINPRTPKRVLATGRSGVWLSTNGGSSWRVVHSLSSGAGPVAWAPSEAGVAYAVGFDRALYKTIDGGASWRRVV